MITSEDKKEAILIYLNLPQGEKSSLREFCHQAHITRKTFYAIKMDWRDEKLGIPIVKAIMEKTLSSEPVVKKTRKKRSDSKYDSEEGLRSRTEDVDLALLAACKDGNAQALKLYFQLTNRLIEKQEINVGLTADERIRRELQAEREIREWERRMAGQGTEEVPKEPPLLSN